MNRRDFLKSAAGTGAAAITLTAGCVSNNETSDEGDEESREAETLYPASNTVKSITITEDSALNVQFSHYDAVEGEIGSDTYSAQVTRVAVARDGHLLRGTEPQDVMMGAPKYRFTPQSLPDGQYRVLSQTDSEASHFPQRDIKVAYIQPFTISNGDVVTMGEPRLQKFGDGDGK